jgi:hypothetical protein
MLHSTMAKTNNFKGSLQHASLKCEEIKNKRISIILNWVSYKCYMRREQNKWFNMNGLYYWDENITGKMISRELNVT